MNNVPPSRLPLGGPFWGLLGTAIYNLGFPIFEQQQQQLLLLTIVGQPGP
jgi:hypothetical protein